MSWRKITMKFPGTCIVCNEKIDANQIGFWAKDVGVKHEKCAQTNELQCSVCGGPAGCSVCEFRDECNLELVSQLCICKNCSTKDTAIDLYMTSVKKKFTLLNTF